MRAGSLRRRVKIQVRSSSQDSYGQALSTWTDVLTDVPASLEPLAGREREIAHAIHPGVDTRITLRYHAQLASPSLAASYRVAYDNAGVTRLFNVAAVMNLEERNRTIEMMATEGLNEGG